MWRMETTEQIITECRLGNTVITYLAIKRKGAEEIHALVLAWIHFLI